MAQKVKGRGSRKYGRTKRKQDRKGSPISNFSRGKISGEDYFKQTGQKAKH